MEIDLKEVRERSPKCQIDILDKIELFRKQIYLINNQLKPTKKDAPGFFKTMAKDFER